MTLKARLTLLTSLAVALAIVVASVAAWLLIRATLMDEVDQRLLGFVPDVDHIPEMVVNLVPDEEVSPMVMRLRGDPVGVQLIDSDGSIIVELTPGDIPMDVDPEEQVLLAEGEGEPHLRTVTVDAEIYRVVSAPLGTDRVIRMVQSLAPVESAMTRMTWMLAAVAGIGSAVAGGLGWTISRAALRPVDGLALAAEEVAETKDLAHRIEVTGDQRDEVARLADSFNAMLAALEGARTQQRELVENAGHELRTPLATLRNDIGLLLRSERHPDRTLDAEARERLLADLETEVAALSELVAEVIDLARGEIEPEPVLETDLRSLVGRAVARARKANASVEVVVAGSTLDVEVRPVGMERAITNLVRNAIQVSDDGGEVEVLLDSADGQAVVQVLDRGPGVSDVDMPRIFDRFYRGSAARERHGSGLGLAIVAQVAELHGGRVKAVNREDGGAVFTLRVPIPRAIE